MPSPPSVARLLPLLAALATAPAGAASFDCARATTALERAICDDEQLNEADGSLGRAYAAALRLSPPAEAERLRAEQRSWLAERLERCSVTDLPCLRALVGGRTQELLDRSSELPVVGLVVDEAEQLLPAGWTLGRSAKGDLDGDGREDLAVAIEPGPEWMTASEWLWSLEVHGKEPPRRLLVLLGQEDGRLRCDAEGRRALLSPTGGGVWGDPLESLSVDDGALVVRHYGGSADRWSIVQHYRQVAGKWVLVRQRHGDHPSAARGEPSSVVERDLVTGATVVEAGCPDAADGPERTTRVEVAGLPAAELPRLSEVAAHERY